ncbi:MAG: GFA family protein [Pseudomonadota bacterium]
MTRYYTGGCQCGAVRYRFETLGVASICHCRMCQKAAGNIFLPLVLVEGFEWTRGERGAFASSNMSTRGFCSDCGTPLTLETRDQVEVAIGSLDDPGAVKIAYHANIDDRLDAATQLHEIPDADPERKRENDDWNAKIRSFQHPDRDTEEWPPEFWFTDDHF